MLLIKFFLTIQMVMSTFFVINIYIEKHVLFKEPKFRRKYGHRRFHEKRRGN